MPYCPLCHTEYQSGFSTCSDCGVDLVEGTPKFCPHCKSLVSEDDVFCDHCGRVQKLPEGKDIPECDIHTDREAVAGCVLCGKPLCRECTTLVEDAAYCTDDSHYRINMEYVQIHRTTTDYEAAMIKANLEGAGIDAVVFNQHDHVYFVNVGALAVVKVMVRRRDEERAKEIITAILSSDVEDKEQEES